MLIRCRNRHQISVVGKPLKLPALRADVTASTAVKTSVLYPAFPFVLRRSHLVQERSRPFCQLRPQRSRTAFQVQDGKGCHPFWKNRTQRPTVGRIFRVIAFCFSRLLIHWFAPRILKNSIVLSGIPMDSYYEPIF